ncbi:MAG TPA: hypothetical protein DCY88_19140, partial [Cyanobacteria bacterium UBA11372]|nr:hypothetical protein [Cyanobacteria bacterium UBA11372]
SARIRINQNFATNYHCQKIYFIQKNIKKQGYYTDFSLPHTIAYIEDIKISVFKIINLLLSPVNQEN